MMGLVEALLMYTHNIHIPGEIRKISTISFEKKKTKKKNKKKTTLPRALSYIGCSNDKVFLDLSPTYIGQYCAKVNINET